MYIGPKLCMHIRLGYFGFQLFMQISGASSWAKINGPILYICKKKKLLSMLVRWKYVHPGTLEHLGGKDGTSAVNNFSLII